MTDMEQAQKISKSKVRVRVTYLMCWQRSETEPPNVWKVSHLGRVRVYASLLSSVPLSQ